MKLAAQSGDHWQFQLTRDEANLLSGLLGKFPFTQAGLARISKTKDDDTTAEREALLRESLVEHRLELVRAASRLLQTGRWKNTEDGCLLTLDDELRECLLQVLNDIRVGCWQALGEPENIELPAGHASPEQKAYRSLMNLAGYYEASLLEPEAGAGEDSPQ